jgi:uncharacterized protein YciI
LKKQYVVMLPMLDMQKSADFRQAHLDYLETLWQKGVLAAFGRFVDGSGGMLIFTADDELQVKEWVLADPYIVHQARTYEIREWALAKANLQK